MTRSFGKSWYFDELSCQVQLAAGDSDVLLHFAGAKSWIAANCSGQGFNRISAVHEKGQVQFATVKCVGRQSVHICEHMHTDSECMCA